MLEGNDRVAGFFRTQPRHRKLLSINEVHTGYDDRELNRRWDWNALLCEDERLSAFRSYSDDYFPDADDLVRYLEDFADHHALNIRFGARVDEIDESDGRFVVTDSEGRVVRARNLVIATGLSKPHIPDIPGIELCEDYSDISVDPMDFRGERILIIGKGNSAFETAENLIGTTALIHLVSLETIDFAWRSHYVGDLRAVNNNILDTYQLKSQNAILDAQVTRIVRGEHGLVAHFDYEHAGGESESIPYDRVITCAGFHFDASPFAAGCTPVTVHGGKFPDMGWDWQSSNVDGLYFAGVLMHRLDYRKKQSGFIHGFRYNVACLAKLLDERYHGVSYPSRIVAREGRAVAQAILDDVNGSSALWQQSGFLCSAIVPEEEERVRYYEGLPIGLVHERFADAELRDEPPRAETHSRSIFCHFRGLRLFDELKSETLHFRHVIYEGLLLPSMVDVDLLSDLHHSFGLAPSHGTAQTHLSTRIQTDRRSSACAGAATRRSALAARPPPIRDRARVRAGAVA